jgi:hypothetical protein
MAQTITDDTVRQIRRNLIKFGYAGLTLETVQEQIALVQGGANTAQDGLSIIGLFARTMLIKNGFIKEEAQP